MYGIPAAGTARAAEIQDAFSEPALLKCEAKAGTFPRKVTAAAVATACPSAMETI